MNTEETKNKQSIKNFRFSNDDYRFIGSEFDMPFSTEKPKTNSLYDYLGWIFENYNNFIDRKGIHMDHFDRKTKCLKKQYYAFFKCTNCSKPHWARLPCNSFFCEECHAYLVQRAQSSLAGYLWNVRHRFIVFTTPPEVRDKLTWGNMHWFYKAIHKTLTYYFNHYYSANKNSNQKTGKSRKVQVGMMAVLHSYGSQDLKWKPHMNVMYSCRGFKQKTEKGETKTFAVNTSYIDYNKLREIYKRTLEYYFCIKLKQAPMINVDDDKHKDNNDRLLGIPPQRVVSSLAQYFKKLPFKDKAEGKHKSDIINIDDVGNITWTNYKRKKLKLDPITTPPIPFYNLIMQHIPPKNFRNVRLWGCYQYNHKLRKLIPPLKKPKEVEPMLCSECHAPLELIGIVAGGEVLFPKFNSKDFSSYEEHPDLRGGRPPDEWEPQGPLLFRNSVKQTTKKRDVAQPQPIYQSLDNEILITQGHEFEFFNPKLNYSKQSHLDNLYFDIGKQNTNFRICKTYLKEGEQFFSKWYKFVDVTGTMFIDKCNQREQLKNEIILDQDKGNYPALIKKLKDDNIRFYAYATKQGRAQHIHCYFDNLAELSKFEREKIREAFIKKYGCDLAFKIDSHMVALEFCEHWKTGAIKKLIDYNSGYNTIIIKESATTKVNKEFEEFLKIKEMV